MPHEISNGIETSAPSPAWTPSPAAMSSPTHSWPKGNGGGKNGAAGEDGPVEVARRDRDRPHDRLAGAGTGGRLDVLPLEPTGLEEGQLLHSRTGSVLSWLMNGDSTQVGSPASSIAG